MSEQTNLISTLMKCTETNQGIVLKSHGAWPQETGIRPTVLTETSNGIMIYSLTPEQVKKFLKFIILLKFTRVEI